MLSGMQNYDDNQLSNQDLKTEQKNCNDSQIAKHLRHHILFEHLLRERILNNHKNDIFFGNIYILCVISMMRIL